MIDISAWTKEFLQKATETFGDRIWFVGLQGSYGRGEATETSDIDIADYQQWYGIIPGNNP